MPKYYFKIKGKNGNSLSSNWSFPPIFSGLVEASDKKSAKSIIDGLYDKKFPLRVLNKDLESNEFLLAIDEIDESSIYYKKIFSINVCEVCNSEFKVIDKYNNDFIYDKGSKYCSDECKTEHLTKFQPTYTENNEVSNSSVIYKITNKKTNKSYIGKTRQVFTLRWYQHFYQLKDTKFHKEIKESKLSDWTFEILEEIKRNNINESMDEHDKKTLEIERYYINLYDTVNNGYNSL